MRILKLQNTILLSLLVAGATASVACSSSDIPAPQPAAPAGEANGDAAKAPGNHADKSG